MAFTITKLGAGSVVRLVDASNDAMIAPTASRDSCYLELDTGDAIYRPSFLICDGSPNGTHGALEKGSIGIDVTNGHLYIKTGAVGNTTWGLVGLQQ